MHRKDAGDTEMSDILHLLRPTWPPDDVYWGWLIWWDRRAKVVIKAKEIDWKTWAIWQIRKQPYF